MNISIRLQRVSRLAAGILLCVSIGVWSTAAAEAAGITPDNINPGAHFSDCLGAMFNDPGAHKEFCGPGQPASNSTLAPRATAPLVSAS